MKYLVFCVVLFVSCAPTRGNLDHPRPGEFRAVNQDPSVLLLALTGTWIATKDPRILQQGPEGLETWEQEVPGGWGLQGKTLGDSEVFLTATVTAPQAPGGMWGLILPDIFSAYTLWINGERVFTKGRLESPGAPLREEVGRGVARFPWTTSTLRIVLQIQNKSTPKGGIQGPLYLGGAKTLNDELSFAVGTNYFLVGAFLIVALLHLFQFLVWPKIRADLYLGLFTLMAFIRGILTDQRVLTQWLQIPFELQFDLEYGTVFGLVIFISFYIKSLFPSERSPLISRLLLLGNLCYLGLLIPLNTREFVPIFDTYLVIFLLTMGYNTYQLVLGVKAGREGAGSLLGGIVFVLIVAISDMLNALGVVGWGSYFTQAFFIFLLLQSFLLVRRASQINQEAKKSLETLVRRRKSQDIFLANSTHELKTPLHGINGGIASLLDLGGLSPETTQSLQEALSEGEKFDKTLKTLLDPNLES